MNYFSTEARDLLHKSGWSPKRNIDISKWVNFLSNYNLSGHPIAFELLKSIGEIKISPIPNSNCNFEPITFNPTLAGSLTWNELDEINQESGLNLYPIGCSRDTILAISSVGKVYGLLSDIVYRIGNTSVESFDCLFGIRGNIIDLDWDYVDW